MRNHAFLGQVAITPGAGFGGSPWSVSTPLAPGMSFPPPPGAPLTTEENTARWICPDGVERILTLEQAEKMGCTRQTLAGRLGQDGAPPDGGTPPPPPPSAPSPMLPGPTRHRRHVRVLQYPQYYPYFYPVYQQPQQRLVCRKLEEESEEEGSDVFECVYEPVPQQQAFVTYPVTQFRPFGWW